MTWVIQELVKGEWVYAETIEAPSQDAAARAWLATNPSAKFRVVLAKLHRLLAS